MQRGSSAGYIKTCEREKIPFPPATQTHTDSGLFAITAERPPSRAHVCVREGGCVL